MVASNIDYAKLRALVGNAIANLSDLNTHETLGDACVSLGLPEPPTEGTKRQRVWASFAALSDNDLPRVGTQILNSQLRIDSTLRNDIQDQVWANLGTPEIPKKTRREISRDLVISEYGYSFDRFMMLLESLWVIGGDLFESDNWSAKVSRDDIGRHVFHNPDDWSTEYLFEQLDAFDASNIRFARFLEGLVSADNIPDEAAQRNIVGIINRHLLTVGAELREVDTDGGYPVFSIVSTRTTHNRRPKNLIFASPIKPDIRFISAVDNDIEIVGGNPTDVLVYDRPIGADGLKWRDLQAWWKDTQQITNDTEAKNSLYSRLRQSLPEASPPQKNLFAIYHGIYGSAIPNLPALLPEVWLHWDHKTAKQRGPEALLRFRMDFLLLLPQQQRVVIEVDGRQHYTNADGLPDSHRYADNMRGDRDLKLSGYEVFRFGATELIDAKHARTILQPFFDDLFRRFNVNTLNETS